MGRASWEPSWIQRQGKSGAMFFPRRVALHSSHTMLHPHSTPWESWAGWPTAAAWSPWTTEAASRTSGLFLMTTAPDDSSRIFTNQKSMALPGLRMASASPSRGAPWSKTSCSSQPPVNNPPGESSSNSRMQGLHPSAVLGLRFCGEVAAFALSDEHHPIRIGLLKIRDDRVIRHIRKTAPLPDIFHVPSAFSIELMKERIVPPIEFQWMHTEPLAQA